MLAASGFTSDADQLEAPLGYFSLYGSERFPDGAGSLGDALGGLDNRGPEAITLSATRVVMTPPGPADAALSVRQKVRLEQISHVNITLEPGGLRPLIHHRPQTGLEAKFSLEFVAANGATLMGKSPSTRSPTSPSNVDRSESSSPGLRSVSK